MIKAGKVMAVFPNRRSYMVLIDNGVVVDASVIETGTDFTVMKDDRVACAMLPEVGWKIVGKFRAPQVRKESNEQQQTVAQRIAEEQAWLNSILTRSNLSDQTNYLKDDEEPLLEGEVALRSLINESSVTIFNDGSIVGRITDALLFFMSKIKGIALLSAKRLILRLIPGVKVDVGLQETGETQNPDTTTKPKVKATVTLASDPDKPEEQDVFLEVGDLDKNAERYGASNKTRQQILSRGLRFIMEKFSIAEVDNDRGEMRLTYIQSEEKKDPKGNPFQIRINDDEVVLSWGEQYLSLTDTGLMIKANRIGLAGPVDMWDPAQVAAFSHRDGFPSVMTPDPVTLKWYAEGQPPGLLCTKSIYFGDSKEPALLKNFIDQYMKNVWAPLMSHTHPVAAPGGTTGPMSGPALELFNTGTLDNPAFERLWYSLVTISG